LAPGLLLSNGLRAHYLKDLPAGTVYAVRVIDHHSKKLANFEVIVSRKKKEDPIAWTYLGFRHYRGRYDR